MKHIHLFEPTGYSGVFQHAYQLGLEMGSRDDVRVTLHTAQQHETLSGDSVAMCRCGWWPRANRKGGPLSTKFKQLAIAARLIAITVPHLILTASRGTVLHLQGPGAGGALNLLLLWTARLRGCRVVYSPHDTFSRRGRLDGRLMQWVYRPTHAIIVHSGADQRRLAKWSDRVHVAPLVQYVPRPSPGQIQQWRQEWAADDAGQLVVLCPGFIRTDRRLDLLVDSARRWPGGWRLAVVGADGGGWARSEELIKRWKLSVSARIEFIGLDEFTAAIAAADLIVVPSQQASQSGVLVLARQLGTPTVAADVGGMRELASRTFSAGNADALTAAICAELSDPSTPQRGVARSDSLDGYLHAYGEFT